MTFGTDQAEPEEKRQQLMNILTEIEKRISPASCWPVESCKARVISRCTGRRQAEKIVVVSQFSFSREDTLQTRLSQR